jgi:colanic acid/amylovoran biosynthesis glycosyltransferase
MKSVLHYKTNYLNPSETFIHRLVSNHHTFVPAALCYRRKAFSDGLPVYEVPETGFQCLTNTLAFHLNLPLPFYNRILQKHKPDIIHSHFGYDGMKMAKPALKHSIPHVVSFYGSDVSRLPQEFGWKRRYRRLASMADHFIAASGLMKNRLIRLGFPEQKISIVRFGLDTDQIAFKKNYSLSPNLMMVGRMVEKKGFEYAIRAVAKLNASGKNLTLDLYGDGPQKTGLQELAKDLNTGDSIRFNGYQPVDDVIAQYSQHSLLLAPSVTATDGDMEGLPNTILEAMASGTPVISTKHAAIPEAVVHNQTGFLAEERDTDALAKILNRIFDNRFDLEKIRLNARATIEREYSVNTMVARMEEIYEALIRK